MKALNCMYRLSKLISQHGLANEEILERSVMLIPPAFQCPDTTCARIQIGGKIFQTDNFIKTDTQLVKEIVVFDEPVGLLRVCRFFDGMEAQKDPFLHEEELLVIAVAERLGKTMERSQAQMELKESENRFRVLVENSLIGISIIQGNEVVYQNAEQERLLGPLPRSAVIGDMEKIHPDDIPKVKQFSRAIAQSSSESMDLDFRLLTDEEKPIWVTCRMTRVVYHNENALLVNMMDVTQSRELEKLLITQDKMASLGRVAAGIAHEIRNPLSGINIYLNALEKFIERGEEKEQIKDVFRQMTAASRKIESVIRRVMDFSKPNQPNFELAHLNDPIQEALNLTATTLKKSGIVLEVDLAENLPKCKIDPQQIEEVVLNLITNAADAMRTVHGEKKIRIISESKKDQVHLRIIDSGPGILLEDKTKIFDPFYTTKSDSTGIGLSICHRIVADHQGEIQVLVSRWGGAEFNIRIPVANYKS
jgi:PAS domain S-box-containing protein